MTAGKQNVPPEHSGISGPVPVSKKIAVIDLGTNTFHLLIGRCDGQRIHILHKEKQFVHLGKQGLGYLTEDAMQRGLKTLTHFKRVTHGYKPEDIHLSGTAALRSAENAGVFIERVRHMLGWNIRIISGLEEARLIHRGIYGGDDELPGDALIMDIGGGSVEFIHSRHRILQWAQSFDIGISVLKAFHSSDPLNAKDRKKLSGFLYSQLTPLSAYLSENRLAPIRLIGASGSFDTLYDMIAPADGRLHISLPEFRSLFDRLMGSTLEERLEMRGLPAPRAVYIPLAMMLVDEILSLCGSPAIYVSPNAMKEGILYEMCGKTGREE